MKKPLLTKSILRNAIWNFAVIIILYLIFHLFAFLEINKIAYDELSKKIFHEIEHLEHFIAIVDDKFILERDDELRESDFREFTDNAFFLQIYDLKGNIVLASENLKYLNTIPIKIVDVDNHIFEEKITIDNYSFLSCYKVITNDMGEPKFIIQLSSTNFSVNNILKEFFLLSLITSPLILVIVVIVSYLLSRRKYNSLNTIIELANEISAQNISKRLNYEADEKDVYGKLKITLNSLFDRLEKQINHIKEFSDNASHQLMSPLTAIKTELEYIEKKDRNIEEYKNTNTILKTQTEKMISIIKTLLLMSKESNDFTDKKKVFSLNKLINDLYSHFSFDSNLIIEINDEIHLRGNEEYFYIALTNIVENAFKYSNNQTVSVSNEVIDKYVIIKIADLGIGIKDEEKEKIFYRFFRGNNLNQNIQGHGLGLSLVKSIITSMDGEIIIKNNEPKGTIFILKFPLIVFD